jgi:thiol-disulfide isomerase/thioredoxin
MITAKKSLFIQLFFWIPLLAIAQRPASGKVTLKGRINGNAPKEISIAFIDSLGNGHRDTIQVDQGEFEFKGTINGPTRAAIYGKFTTKFLPDPNIAIVYLEPGLMEINLTVNDFPSAKVKGSATQDDYQKLNDSERSLMNEWTLLDKAIDSLKKMISSQGNSKDLQDQMSILDSRRAKWVTRFKENRYRFIKENGNSAYSAVLMPRMINDNTIPLDSAEMIYDKFPKVVKNSAIGIDLKSTITGKHALAAGILGKPAPLLNGIDINRKILRSEDYIGKKYLLLDFWASWCGPCHDEFPYLIDLYNKYNKGDFEIIGVSADGDETVWKKILSDLEFKNGGIC